MRKILTILAVCFFASAVAADSDKVSAEADDSKIYVKTTHSAEYEGGYDALAKYFADNVKLSQFPQSEGGRVMLSVVVEKDGSVSDAIILNGVDPQIDDEVLKFAKTMPKWKPADLNGEKVRFRAVFSVEIR